MAVQQVGWRGKNGVRDRLLWVGEVDDRHRHVGVLATYQIGDFPGIVAVRTVVGDINGHLMSTRSSSLNRQLQRLTSCGDRSSSASTIAHGLTAFTRV
jgi:hypothetical protein